MKASSWAGWLALCAVLAGCSSKKEDLIWTAIARGDEVGARADFVRERDPVIRVGAMTAVVVQGRSEMVRDFVLAGADATLPNRDGFNLLFLAVRSGCLECARWLLRAGADVNLPSGPLRHRPLEAAVWAQSPPFVELLLSHGANPNEPDVMGDTPLHAAVRLDWVLAPEVIDLLGRYGVDFGATDARGLTPLHVAIEYDNLAAIRALLASGASPDTPSAEEMTPLAFALEIEHVLSADLLWRAGAVTPPGFVPPLHSAAAIDDVGRASLLLTMGGTDPEALFDSRTPLDVARENRSTLVTALLVQWLAKR